MDDGPSANVAADVPEAVSLLRRALEILDRHSVTADAAIYVSHAIDRLENAPSVLEQWYLVTGRDAEGGDLS